MRESVLSGCVGLDSNSTQRIPSFTSLGPAQGDGGPERASCHPKQQKTCTARPHQVLRRVFLVSMCLLPRERTPTHQPIHSCVMTGHSQSRCPVASCSLSGRKDSSGGRAVLRGKLLLSCNCDLKNRQCSQGSDLTMGEEAPSPLGSGGHCGHQQLTDAPTAHGHASSSRTRLTDTPTAQRPTNSSQTHLPRQRQVSHGNVVYARLA